MLSCITSLDSSWGASAGADWAWASCCTGWCPPSTVGWRRSVASWPRGCPPGLWAAHDPHRTVGGGGGSPACLAAAVPAQAGTRGPTPAQTPVRGGRQGGVQVGPGQQQHLAAGQRPARCGGEAEGWPGSPARSPRAGRTLHTCSFRICTVPACAPRGLLTSRTGVRRPPRPPRCGLCCDRRHRGGALEVSRSGSAPGGPWRMTWLPDIPRTCNHQSSGLATRKLRESLSASVRPTRTCHPPGSV